MIVSPADANEEYARGRTDVQTVGRIPPCYVGSHWPRSMVIAYIRQRCAVHRQIFAAVEIEKFREQLTGEWNKVACMEVERKGYPRKWIAKALATVPPGKNDKAIHVSRNWFCVKEEFLN